MISPKSTLSCKEANERLDVGLPNPLLFVTGPHQAYGELAALGSVDRGDVAPAHAGGRGLGYLMRKRIGRF